MIISASRRTDIPAFYAKWFMERLRAGFVDVRPPFAKSVKQVSLAKGEVTAFIFWTRNFRPLLPHLAEIRAKAPFYVTYTVTNYPRKLEAHTPHWQASLETISQLVAVLGRGAVVWRYDPIILTPETPPAFHCDNFALLAEKMAKQVDRVVISLSDPTAKAVQGLKRAGVEWIDPLADPGLGLAGRLASIAKDQGLEVQSCAEPVDLAPQGIQKGACIDAALLNDLFGLGLNPVKDRGQRAQCLCHPAIDIGSYNTCLHGCAYCYATGRFETAQKNFKAHDPMASLLGQ